MDTDRIMPARFLVAVSFEGLEKHLFEDDRKADPHHPFNDARYRGASILVVNANFGCGSSREHAVWAIQQAGYAAVIAPSFGDIFYSNATKNGLLPIVLPEEDVKAIMSKKVMTERKQLKRPNLPKTCIGLAWKKSRGSRHR